MCTVSNMGGTYQQTWPHRWPTIPQPTPYVVYTPTITREEFEALKREMELMKELLKAAKRYDVEHGEPDCEIDDKVEFLKQVAELVGVDLEEVFGNTP